MSSFRRSTNRPALTLVELMAVIAIIATLAALILPAVQYSREVGRRFTCKNNLRQMALALHDFHAAQMHFPAGRDGVNDLDHSWATWILPHLEQGPIFDCYDFRRPWHAGGPGGGNFG